MSAQPDPVVVVGGGLAGITAALRCAEGGRRVVLFEASDRLGGRAGSRGRDRHDIGQHVLLRCFDAYRELLDRLGSAPGIAWQRRLRLPIVGPDGRAVLARAGLPAPLHLLPLTGLRPVPWSQRLRLPAAGLALAHADRGPDEPLGGWLARHGQGRAARRWVWAPLLRAALNTDPDTASVHVAAAVARALVARRDAADLGVPRWPLEELHAAPALRTLQQLGVTVALHSRVTALQPVEGGVEVTVRQRGRAVGAVRAGAVVLAVPPPAASRLLPALCRETATLTPSPIVDVEFAVGQRLTLPRVVGTASDPPLWVFHRRQRLVVSISAADELIGAGDDEVAARVEATLVRCRLVDPGVLRLLRVTRAAAATTRQLPGTLRRRPLPGPTATPGVYLAGDWTRTGLPDTMEAAVRSGWVAAAAVLGAQRPAPHWAASPEVAA